ncbi:MAG: alpha-glucan family phosphorylase [Anaerolineales bacterium]|nr:alpha-glucan family phosphorylase [Anaerolineales bacterium]
MQPICTFTVVPSLPTGLERLRDLAYNVWWCWNLGAIDLFRRLDRDLWEESGHNPVLMLGGIKQERLEEAAEDEGFLAHLERVFQQFDRYVHSPNTWYKKAHGAPALSGSTEPVLSVAEGLAEVLAEGSEEPCIAYFSAEFGLTDCIPNYAGGMGVLAGDHLKSASDLGLPLVGVGLLYQKGYFHQYLNPDGWQQELYPQNDFYNMPVRLEQEEDGTPVTVRVDYPGRKVAAQVWRAQVGRVSLFLLDTNIPVNNRQDQDITDELYGGDLEMRIRQEIMLGIGGIRALETLGIRPTICHMNEGHSAFLALERIRILMKEQELSFAEAREAASSGNVFTTHTPVPAGIDRFPPHLMDKYFSNYYKGLGLSREEFLALGRENPADNGAPFSMAILALRLAANTNGVSQLHGQVSRRMWQGIWPGVPEDEVPITSVTNGIHIPSWISLSMARLYGRYLGPRWLERPDDQTVWERVDGIPDEELWRTHERRRERLVAAVRRRLCEQLNRRGVSPSEIERASEVLDPKALTIGFARRFATYKRAPLILRDPDRLARILNDTARPVQIIFAGKAHPQDNPGKELIQQVVRFSRQEEFRRRMIFIEDYDVSIARYLLQGVDIWLNTPLRPREASGTSGMKAAANGVLNMSTLDGWWDEAYQPDIGWAIGRGELYEDLNYQNEIESKAIYGILEKEIVPLFYDRNSDGLPHKWIARMKATMRTICPAFNTNRMVREYTERFYLPAAQRHQRLTENEMARAKALAHWKSHLHEHWADIRVDNVEAEAPAKLKVGAELQVRAQVNLGALEPKDVAVQLYYGLLDTRGEILKGEAIPMKWVESNGDGSHVFVGPISCRASGRYGYALRVLPHHEDLSNPYEPGLILWAC